MPIVAEEYAFVIGVDTHAATHSLALVTGATGGVIDEVVFPNSRAGLDRALTWITRKIDGQSALVVIEGVGSYGAGLADRVANAGLLVAEPSVMPAVERRGVGKMRWTRSASHARSWPSILHGYAGRGPPASGSCSAF
jgi:transposase